MSFFTASSFCDPFLSRSHTIQSLNLIIHPIKQFNRVPYPPSRPILQVSPGHRPELQVRVVDRFSSRRVDSVAVLSLEGEGLRIIRFGILKYQSFEIRRLRQARAD